MGRLRRGGHGRRAVPLLCAAPRRSPDQARHEEGQVRGGRCPDRGESVLCSWGRPASPGSAGNRCFLGGFPPPGEDAAQEARPAPLGPRTLTVPETLGLGVRGRRTKLEGARAPTRGSGWAEPKAAQWGSQAPEHRGIRQALPDSRHPTECRTAARDPRKLSARRPRPVGS